MRSDTNWIEISWLLCQQFVFNNCSFAIYIAFLALRRINPVNTYLFSFCSSLLRKDNYCRIYIQTSEQFPRKRTASHEYEKSYFLMESLFIICVRSSSYSYWNYPAHYYDIFPILNEVECMHTARSLFPERRIITFLDNPITRHSNTRKYPTWLFLFFLISLF